MSAALRIDSTTTHRRSEPDTGNKESYEMNAPVDLAAVKGRQQLAWASGDYAVVGTTLQIVGESLAEACDLRWDEDVLDVAAATGMRRLPPPVVAPG
jgi:hypothetical protein